MDPSPGIRVAAVFLLLMSSTGFGARSQSNTRQSDRPSRYNQEDDSHTSPDHEGYDHDHDGTKTLLEKESIYHYIRVQECGGSRYLYFRRSGSDYQESAINIARPLRLEMEYYRLMFSAFAHQPDPKRLLFIGLGGGTLSMAFRHYFPKMHIDNVELDPDVAEVAKKYFGFKEDGRMKLFIRDGRVQVRKFLREKQQYDIIIVDAFRGGYIPYHLTTKEYMTQLKGLLAPDGIVVTNLRSGFESYHYHRRTLVDVFPNDWSYGSYDSGGNVIVVSSSRADSLAMEQLKRNAKKLQEEKAFTLNLPAVVSKGKFRYGFQIQGPILTDDYAPTDVLRGIPRGAVQEGK